MFGKHHTLKQLSGAVTFAASLAIIAAPSAGAANAREVACATSAGVTSSPYPGWVSVDDDLGVPYLYPARIAPYPTLQSCGTTPAPSPQASTQASVATTPTFRSPYPGWTVVFDDLGTPWLSPTGNVAV